MEDLAALSVREVKKAAAEEKETRIPFQKDSENQIKKQSLSNNLSDNLRRGDVHWRERSEKEGRLVVLVGDQNLDPEAPPRSLRGRKKREQRRRQGRNDCQRSNEEE